MLIRNNIFKKDDYWGDFMNRRKIENIFIICILTVFMGQIYISPFAFGFRLSFAVVMLALFLIYFEDYNELLISTLVGILMFLFRSFIHYVEVDGVTWSQTVALYLPVLAFYIPYGMLFSLLEVRKKFYKPIPFMISLWVCDSIPNILESVMRRAWSNSPFDKVVLAIILIGGIRTIFTYFVFWISHYYVKRFKSDQKEKYFRELIIFTAKLKTELFFLRKSKNDIEEAMVLSHRSYENTKDLDIKPDLLKIAKEIHEVKKDYSRVIEGMETTLNKESVMKYMSIRDILLLIRDNASNLSNTKGKNIDIKIDHDRIFTTQEFYPIISVLNNLTINAIDALGSYGHITILSHFDKDTLCLSVKDDGDGIDPEDLDAIFDAGYSTKYDPETGNMSTGIGLTHVKQIVENHFSGTIQIESKKGWGSEFLIRIPRNRLSEGK